ncbi:hypothetical protein [Paucibacter sp. KBW04]|uniref:hypothetical protein n=1 Tax=Paucibacter sp. KBW04 TaxID=2153361 RepID=UPI0026C02CFE
MELIPVVLFLFKVIVLGTGMFIAIKWHYDKEKKNNDKDVRAVLIMGAKVAAAFTLLALGLVFATFTLGGRLGLDLTFL